jgi:hypothetical protein
MSVTGLYTARDIVTQAFRKVGIGGIGEEVAGEEFEQGLMELDMMLKNWQSRGMCRWLRAVQTVPLTTAASYTLNPVRPMTIDGVRIKVGGIETPLTPMTGEEYDTLPQKTSTGRPSTYFYARQREDARLYVWPVLAAANGETLEVTYTREIADIRSPANNVDLPGEWWEVVVYNLASRLSDTFSLQNDRVTARAEMMLRDALAFDREASVFFGEAYGDDY